MTLQRIGSIGLLGVLGVLSLDCSDAGVVDNPHPNIGGNGGTTSVVSSGSNSGGSASTSGSSGGTGQAGGGEGGSATAGSGGMGGTTGSSGAGGAGGVSTSGDGGAAASIPSMGCGMPAAQALNSWVEQPTLSVNAKNRQWWVWLPTNYNPSRAYPVVFTFHGCGGPTNFIPMQKVTGEDAIVVRGTGIDPSGCWTYSGTGEDVSFFDAMLADLQAKRCVDTSRVFLTGYSSGSWFTNTLECVRGDKLRATGTVSGGVAGNRGTCKGKYARLFVHDANDTTNYFIRNGDTTRDGNYVERARLITLNHCAADTPPVPEDPAPCARYQNCDPGYPVIMCQTTGKGHDRQDTLATSAFWGLFSSL